MELGQQNTNGKRGKGAVTPLFQVDGRTRLGRRVAELEAVYTEALGGALTAVQGEQVKAAAQLAVLAELARAAYAGGRGSLDDVVRVENRAARALKALNLKSQEAKPSRLAQILQGAE